MSNIHITDRQNVNIQITGSQFYRPSHNLSWIKTPF
jgi:hypothetical protein